MSMSVFFGRRCRSVFTLLWTTCGLLAMSACGGGLGGAMAPTLAIVQQPRSQTVVAGQQATFTVAVTGTAPISYQWSRKGTPLTGANSPAYTTAAAVAADSGNIYTVAISNGAGSATSTGATLTVNTPPTITAQPISQVVNVGLTATFNVTATGTGPLSYQWFVGGNSIPGATSSTYTSPAANASSSGSLYTVMISNVAGSVASAAATLTVSVPPAITVQPLSQTVTAGQVVTFVVMATGTGPLSYRWYLNGSALTGATLPTYSTPVISSANTGSLYTVVVSNVAGAVTSNIATLTVNNTSPVASSLSCTPSSPPYGGTVALMPTFSGGAAAIGSSGVGSSDVSAFASNRSLYYVPAITSGKTYTLTVTGTGGAVASTACMVTPTPVTISAITTANQTAAPIKQTFSAAAAGGVTNDLVWTATGGTIINGVWTPPDVPGTYTITATSVDDPAVSVSTLATISLPVITAAPVSANVCLHGNTTLAVQANYATSYQWSLNGAIIPGATSSSFLIPSALASDAGSYKATAINAAGSTSSPVAVVEVGSSIVQNPLSLTVVNTQTARFTVAATGVSPFGYQWYIVPPGGTIGAVISGAVASSYTSLPTMASSSGSKYYATVTDACGVTLTSSTASLTVNKGNAPPTIINQPVGATVPVGDTTTFSVTAVGTPALTYQWYRIPAGSVTGMAITGATASQYEVPSTAMQSSNNGDIYYVTVTNAYGLATSQQATLAVGNGILVQIQNQPVNVYVNPGQPATFSVEATSTAPLSYQWYEALPGSTLFSPIPAATSNVYTQPSTVASDTGSVFYVVVSNGVSSLTSYTASLFVDPLNGIANLCDTDWVAAGNAISQPNCVFQLTDATTSQHGEIVWPYLVSTGNLQLSFTLATSDASAPAADGFALVLGDPSLGATTASLGATGLGLGAEGIPGMVLAFDDYYNAPSGTFPGDPGSYSNPAYLGVTRGETALWENPYFNVNRALPGGANAFSMVGAVVSHAYVVTIVQGSMTVTMDKVQVFSGAVNVPPVALLYVTASTGEFYERTTISSFSAVVSAPSH